MYQDNLWLPLLPATLAALSCLGSVCTAHKSTRGCTIRTGHCSFCLPAWQAGPAKFTLTACSAAQGSNLCSHHSMMS